jgi:hydroxymethylglutaryl-CoA reductase
VRARGVVGDAVGGDAVADGIARASRFAELDPFRAATHNKGFMNGLDAAAVALGQDWRSSRPAPTPTRRGGPYRPLSTWTRTAEGLEGRVELPLAVGTVGGSTNAHAGVRAAFKLLRVPRRA